MKLFLLGCIVGFILTLVVEVVVVIYLSAIGEEDYTPDKHKYKGEYDESKI